MALPEAVAAYLEQRNLRYRLIPYPPRGGWQQILEAVRIPAHRLLRTVVLQDEAGCLMAIVPGSHLLDFDRLGQILDRDPEPLYGKETDALFPGCRDGSHPPLPALFGLPALLEAGLTQGEVYFDAGSHDTLIGMDSGDFQTLLGEVPSARFAVPLDSLDLTRSDLDHPQAIVGTTRRFLPAKVRDAVEPFRELPALPPTTRRLLALRDDSRARRIDFHAVAENTGLAADLVCWARSPAYNGQRHRILSVQDAITAIGTPDVLDLGLALSIGHAFHLPAGGPLGLNALRRHSVYCAILAGKLAAALPDGICPRPGLVHLSALLHNFGYLLLGHLFPAQFFVFNRFLEVNRRVPPAALESYVLGADNRHIGAWLTRAWNMPPECTAAIRWHLREDYSLPYAEHPNLVLVANRLLHHLDIGYETSSRLPVPILSSLGLNRSTALAALEQVQQQRSELDALCQALFA